MGDPILLSMFAEENGVRASSNPEVFPAHRHLRERMGTSSLQPVKYSEADATVFLGMAASGSASSTPEDISCLLRSLYVGQEATVTTGHGTKDWFQIGKGVFQGCILSLCLFSLYAEYIMRNARLDEAQAGIKIARRNINNLRYADDIMLMAESEEELKSLLMKVKEESEKVGLRRSWHPVPSLHGK
uniref:Uncharacterized protein n=1 Tax=Ovis aries TaxID=9940 RepID=A0AC11E5C9_SHEEP